MTRLTSDVAALGHTKPAVQLLQEAAPVALYKPGWHATAAAPVTPAGHAYPALQ